MVVGGSGVKKVKDLLEVHYSTYNATAVLVDISECNNIILSYMMHILNFFCDLKLQLVHCRQSLKTKELLVLVHPGCYK